MLRSATLNCGFAGSAFPSLLKNSNIILLFLVYYFYNAILFSLFFSSSFLLPNCHVKETEAHEVIIKTIHILRDPQGMAFKEPHFVLG